jgi:hypothetical protein
MREYQVGGVTARALVVEKGVVLLKRSPGLRPGTFSAVPTGLVGLGYGFPGLASWATFSRPFGTGPYTL